MKVTNLKIGIVNDNGDIDKDITDLVLNINITESLYGDLSGYLEIVDGIGALEEYINTQAKIIIDFTYLENKVQQQFIIDGVRHIDISSNIHKKSYVINLKSINAVIDSMSLLSKAFVGKSTEIINKIYKEFFGELDIYGDSLTSGHYICPNISPKKAINRIISQAYDTNNNPFFLFERLGKNNGCLETLGFIKSQPVFFKVEPTITDLKLNEITSPLATIGQPSNIIIHSDNDGSTKKIAKGILGKNFNKLDLSNSGISNKKYGITTGAISISSPFRPDMYTNSVDPLLNSGDIMEVALMNTILSEMDQQLATAYQCIAIPNLSVGYIVDLVIGNNNVGISGVNSKFGGPCIVSKIIHRIDAGDYTQTIDLIKGN